MTEPLDLFDDPNLTFSKLAAAWLLNLDSRMLIGGFARKLCQAVGRANCPIDQTELEALVSQYRVIPDAYLIDESARTAYLFEIEDTNPLSADKLRKLSEIWWRLDCIGWELRVFLIDRYLTCWRSLPLADVWYTLESPYPEAASTTGSSREQPPTIDLEATHRQALKVAINRPIHANDVHPKAT